MNKTLSTLIGFSVLAGGIAALSMISGVGIQSASAAVLSINSKDIPENTTNKKSDCAGFFGKGFKNCDIGNPFELEISPVIAKYDTANSKKNKPAKWKINTTDFPSVDGSEWDTTDFLRTNSSGNWSYTPTPGEDDPAIKYWVARGGNQGFRLFWEVDDAATEAGGACETDLFTVACLSEAKVVTSGIWSTPPNMNKKGKETLAGLSHITFYDGGDPNNGGNGGKDIPEPSAMTGLALLVGGMIAFRRRQS